MIRKEEEAFRFSERQASNVKLQNFFTSTLENFYNASGCSKNTTLVLLIAGKSYYISTSLSD